MKQNTSKFQIVTVNPGSFQNTEYMQIINTENGSAYEYVESRKS